MHPKLRLPARYGGQGDDNCMSISENPVPWDEGWPVVKEGIDNAIRIVENHPNGKTPSPEEAFVRYTAVYYMSLQRVPHQHAQDLYDAYKKTFDAHLSEVVLKRIQSQENPTELLSQIVKAWENNTKLVKLLSHTFQYLSKCYIPHRQLRPLEQVARMSFYERVLQQPFKGQQDVTQELQQQCVGVTISVPIQERAKQALLEVEILIQDGKSDDSDQTENEELLKSVQDLLAQADAELQS